MNISWPRSAVLTSCKSYAPLLPPIDGIDPARMLAAMAMNESSLGANCGPHYDPIWDVDGLYGKDPEQAKLLAEYPHLAACSYGPWQIEYYNAAGWGTPTELNTDLSLVTRASIAYLGREIQRWKIANLLVIGQVWNHGSPIIPPKVPSAGVEKYCKDLAGNYIAAEGWLEG